MVHVQYEIQSSHFHRCLKRMCQAMGVTSANLGDRFHIINARGMNLSGIEGIAKISLIVEPYHPEYISLDPLYKLTTGVGNAAEDAKIILNAFDGLAETTNAAAACVHHNAKGFSGGRDIRDCGAGSNVIGRDYDAFITLTPHVSEPDAAVVDVLLRNYPPQEPFTALWAEDSKTGGYGFQFRWEIAPTRKTSANSRPKNSPVLETDLSTALDILKKGPMPVTMYMDSLRSKTGLTHERSKAFRTWATSRPCPALDEKEKRGRGQNDKLIGRASDIARLRGSK